MVNIMKEHDCLRLIHGHTHRPAIHDFEINGKNCSAVLFLAEWKKEGVEILRWNSKGYKVTRNK